MSLIDSTTTAAAVPATKTGRSFLTNLLRRPLLNTLRGFRLGRLQLDLPDGSSETFGSDEGGPRARISIRDDAFFKKCALHGNVGLGEAYLDGDWDTPDIRAVIEWFIVNLHADGRARGSSQRLRLIGLLRILDRIGHRLRPNSRTMSRRNIEEHYDLGNDFYRLWLDPTMTYSGARFTRPEQTLESAQHDKYEALCQKLKLTAADHVLEIGCGWGGFALHAAARHGCRVTGVTISPAQHAEATQRVREAGLEGRVEIRLQDYRDITGQFDRIVSIEMLEAVGDRYLETWTAKCHEVLAPGGLLAVQMITVPDCDHAELKRGTDFIQKHIFPGSLLLSIGRMNEAMNRTGNLFLHGLEDLGTSYVRTLHQWHDRFNARLADVEAQGFSDRFIRKWNYYLKYCEAAFASRNISVVQAVYTRPANRATLHREDGVIA
jgi:cyclopropane-fatty-acyl-phospholipid synthase